jgi:hypothetical protein
MIPLEAPDPEGSEKKQRVATWRLQLTEMALNNIFDQKKVVVLTRKEYLFLCEQQALTFVFAGKGITPDVFFCGLAVVFQDATTH